MADFLMPSLGADMDEGTLLEWLIKPGDEVHKGDVVAVVDTDKAAIEVESFASGTVQQLIVEPGTRVAVGTVLATIGEQAAEVAAEEKPAKKRGAAKKPARARAATPALPTPPVPPAPPEVAEAVAAVPGPLPAGIGSPLVRHLAAELGVNLEEVHGTGHGGMITREDVALAAAVPAKPAVPAEPAAQAQQPVPPQPRAPQASRRRVSPLARRVAADLGVDLSGVAGTGPDGAVRESDVRRAAEQAPARSPAAPAAVVPGQAAPVPAPASADGAAPASADGAVPAPASGASAASTTQARLAAMRQVTARLMARSKREIPHYYLRQTIDLTRAMAWLHDRNRELAVSERLVPAALLLKATAAAARQVPALNGYWVDDHFEPGAGVHLGVAISLRGGGLVTPAIHDASDLTAGELMERLRDLVTRARTARLRGSELTDATITVTNLGDQGVELVYGVIYPPQVALVGFGKVAERPVAAGGLIGARPVVIATLAADHRATDGYTGARFLAALSDYLQRPEDI